MADLNIHFDLRVPSRLVSWGFAGLLLVAQAAELASEDFTLTTYYPAPSGVYKKMITTADTTLARNSGNVIMAPPGNTSAGGGIVGIGTSAPDATKYKLHVIGTIYGDSVLNPTYAQ